MASFASFATAPLDYHVEVWQSDRGLPHDSVTAILQTSDGYLWVGTQNGLARFDGNHFKVFDENNTPAIKTSRIVTLLEDHNHSLWIGTELGGLICLKDGQFTPYVFAGKGTTHNYARMSCEDGEGDLWQASCEWQLIQFEGGKFSVPPSDCGLTSMKVSAVANDHEGRIWVGTDNELAVGQKGKFQPVWSRANEGNFRVDWLAPGRNGGCWVAASGRLRKFESGRWVADLGAYAWTNRPIYNLYEDSHNCLWVATMGSGLFRYDTNGTVLHLTVKEGLPTDFVRCVTEDREGNVWAGTEGGGLCRLTPAIFQTVNTQQGLSSDQTMSVSESKDGGLWIGSNGNGLDYMKDGRVEHYGVDQGLLDGHVWSVIQDRDGKLWVGTWGGLFEKTARGQFINLSDGESISWQVLAMLEDSQGGIWLGQQALGALTRLYEGERMVIRIPGASPNLDVRAIAEDGDGSIWVGTSDEGLYRRKNGQWTRFGRKEGLASDAIWCLHMDREGTLWVGTCGGGLSRWGNGKFTTWTTQNGLINNVICQILEDDRNNLWLGSYDGVFRIDKKELNSYVPNRSEPIQCVHYGKEYGLPSIQCQGGFQPSGLKSRDGRLWFPTVKGLAVVDPDRVAPNQTPPPVEIEEMDVDGTPQQLERGQEGNPDGQSFTPLKIPPGKLHFDIHYTALSLTAPDEVRFKYRLEGLENNWQDADTRHMVSYPHLPPGSYQFHVIACNNDGVWNTTGASLPILVLPHIWETTWFIGLSMLASLGVVASTARYAVTRKLHRQLELAERESAIERERARIAKDIHDDLGANLTEIALLSELAQNSDAPPEEVHADIRKITAKARDLTRSLDEIVWAVDPKNDTLDNFVTYTCIFAEEYLRVAGISCRLGVPERLPDVPLPANLRHNLFLVLKEALNNIVKHAAASEVLINIALKADVFFISMQDNGRGFMLKSPCDQLIAPSPGPGRRNLPRSGLENMRQRTETIGGRFELLSRPNGGTWIKLMVPLNAASNFKP